MPQGSASDVLEFLDEVSQLQRDVANDYRAAMTKITAAQSKASAQLLDSADDLSDEQFARAAAFGLSTRVRGLAQASAEQQRKVFELVKRQPSVAGKEGVQQTELGLRYIEQNPADGNRWLMVGPILSFADQNDAFRDFCNRMTERFGKTKDDRESRLTVKVCLLHPELVDLDELPIETLIVSTNKAGNAWGWGVRGLLAYRSGDAKLAAEQLIKANQMNPTKLCRATNLPILAMAQHDLGDDASARQTLEASTGLLKKLALPQNLWVRTWLQPSRGGKNTVFPNDNIASGTEYRFDDGFILGRTRLFNPPLKCHGNSCVIDPQILRKSQK